MTATQTFRPTPYPRPAATPRHATRPTGHRLRRARTPLRVAGWVAAGVFGAVTLLLGAVGWVALIATVLG